MTTFNSAFDWDTNLPPSISSLDENDFLLLLQKQFPAVSGEPISPSALSKVKTTVGANPQSLTKFPLPNTSPLSTDSSPSPPSANEDGSANGSEGNHNGSSKRAGSADDEHHKRKASADDFEDEIGGQPSTKSQHTDSKSKKANNTRRKSSGGERTQDESRLLKRKEQNRAAQRAFRERKEKHVKDLEDQVAELVTKTENQATENENLRDILSRLQNENVVLKQTAFTFSVPSTSKQASPDHRRDSSGTPSDALNLFASGSSASGPSSVPASAGSSVTSASTHDSPSSLFEGFDSFSALSDAPIASSSSTAPSVNASTSSPDPDTIAFFGSAGPFTTLSSNPMYTSYRDPMESMNAFASFGGWDGDITMSGPSSSNDNSNVGLEELFGEQFSGLVPFSGEFLTGETKGSPSGPSAANGLSPVGHHNSVSPPHSGDGCPKTKEDIERMISSGEKSIFGAPPVVEGKGSNSTHGSPGFGGPGATPARQNSTEGDYEAAFDKALGRDPTPPAYTGAGKPVYSGDNFNIDELCLDMQRKAKCSYAASTGVQCT